MHRTILILIFVTLAVPTAPVLAKGGGSSFSSSRSSSSFSSSRSSSSSSMSRSAPAPAPQSSTPPPPPRPAAPPPAPVAAPKPATPAPAAPVKQATPTAPVKQAPAVAKTTPAPKPAPAAATAAAPAPVSTTTTVVQQPSWFDRNFPWLVTIWALSGNSHSSQTAPAPRKEPPVCRADLQPEQQPGCVPPPPVQMATAPKKEAPAPEKATVMRQEAARGSGDGPRATW